MHTGQEEQGKLLLWHAGNGHRFEENWSTRIIPFVSITSQIVAPGATNMDDQELNRRDFNRLTMAAFGGVVAGTVAGCGGEDKPAASPARDAAANSTGKSKGAEVAASSGEPHACRGLNACKSQGAGGKNECAGQGECATKAWEHSCSGATDCKGQGGCGDNATQNECKGKGHCSVPLMASVWDQARQHFEGKMKEAGKEVGAAPLAKKQ